MIKSCHPKERYPQRLVGTLMFILLLDTLSIRQTNREGRRGKTIIRDILMKLVVEETLMGPGTKMGMIGMKENRNIIKMPQTIDQPEALITGETLQRNNKKFPVKISDLPNTVLVGSPDTAEFSAGSEAKKRLEHPKLATC